MSPRIINVKIFIVQIRKHVALENCTAIQIGDKPAWNILRQISSVPIIHDDSGQHISARPQARTSALFFIWPGSAEASGLCKAITR